jgi:hypothetical protein
LGKPIDHTITGYAQISWPQIYNINKPVGFRALLKLTSGAAAKVNRGSFPQKITAPLLKLTAGAAAVSLVPRQYDCLV